MTPEATPAPALRVMDGGSAAPNRQLATARAITEHHAAGAVPATLRLYRMPPTVLVGRHQATWSEVSMEMCLADGVGIARRDTGGRAIVVDDNVLVWDLILPRHVLHQRSLDQSIEHVTESVRRALDKQFGEDALPTVEATALSFGPTLAIQGFQRVAEPDVPIGEYLINAPTKAHAYRPTPPPDTASLFVVLATCFAENYALHPVAGALTPSELAAVDRLALSPFGSDEYTFLIDDPIETGIRTASASQGDKSVHAYLRTSWRDGVHHVASATIAGDLTICPPEKLLDLAQSLADQPVANIAARVDKFFANVDVDLAGVSIETMRTVLVSAAEAPPLKETMTLR